MTSSTDDGLVAEALRLAEAATDGPWVVGHPHNVIAQRWRGPVVAEPTAVGNKHNDAAFIAAARSLVPALAARLVAAEAALADANAAHQTSLAKMAVRFSETTWLARNMELEAQLADANKRIEELEAGGQQ